MCAIIDTNVFVEVFGDAPSPGGRMVFDWIRGGRGAVVVGGALLEELKGNQASFKRFQALDALLQSAGKPTQVRLVDDAKVNAEQKRVDARGICRSGDAHIIALARISGARLLWTRDDYLQEDFQNKKLIDRPRGKLFPNRESANSQKVRNQLLANRELCNP